MIKDKGLVQLRDVLERYEISQNALDIAFSVNYTYDDEFFIGYSYGGDKIEGICFSGFYFPELPKDALAIFPELEWLFVREYLITSIPAETLSDLKNLRGLTLWGIGLKSDSSPFLYLSSLKVLHLTGITIETIGVDFLKGLSDLDFLGMTGMYKLVIIHDLAFLHVPNLESLTIEDTKLTKLTSSLKSLSNLKKLYLRGNEKLDLSSDGVFKYLTEETNVTISCE